MNLPEPSLDQSPTDCPAAERSAAEAVEAAFLTFPDQTEPFDFEGRTLDKITFDGGSLRFAFAMGAAWQRGEAWAEPKPAARQPAKG